MKYKNKINVLIIIFFLVLIINYFIPFRLNKNEYVLAGLTPYTSWKNVIKLYGEPLSKTEIEVFAQLWHYHDLKVEIFGDFTEQDKPDDIKSVTVKSSMYPTYRGIKVGDPINKALKKYKFLHKYEEGIYRTCLFEFFDLFISPFTLCYIEFHVKENIITAITYSYEFNH